MAETSTGFRGGIPTATHLDHVGLTVPDLDEALGFFVDVLGCEVVYELGPIERSDDFFERQLGVHPRSSMRVATLRCGPFTNLELFEYSAPDQKNELPKNSDHGGHHLSFFVKDMGAAVAYLREQPGVTVLGEPQTDGGLIEGNEWVYFLAPWGLQLEVRRWEKGQPYEEKTAARMFGPTPFDGGGDA